jgi:hypothetical protein
MIYASEFLAGDDYFTRNGVSTEEEQDEFRRNLEDSFASEVKHNPASTVLISNEHLYSRLHTDKMVRRAKDLLTRVSDNITVVVHVRPQIDFLVSNASQTARMGHVIDSKWFTRKAVGPRNRLYNLSSTVAIWEDVFGPENLRTVPFRRTPDMTEYFIDTLGLKQDSFGATLRANEALGWRALAVSNALIEHGIYKRLGPARFKKLLERLPKTERVQVGLDIAREVQERFAAENADLTSRRPELEPADMEPDWKKYDVEPNVHRIDTAMELAAEIAAAVRFALKNKD